MDAYGLGKTTMDLTHERAQNHNLSDKWINGHVLPVGKITGRGVLCIICFCSINVFWKAVAL